MKLIMAKKKKKAYIKISYCARTKYYVLAKVDSGRNMVPQQNIASQHKFFPGNVWRPDAVCRMDDNGLTVNGQHNNKINRIRYMRQNPIKQRILLHIG